VVRYYGVTGKKWNKFLRITSNKLLLAHGMIFIEAKRIGNYPLRFFNAFRIEAD
jgi:hypothetical protein